VFENDTGSTVKKRTTIKIPANRLDTQEITGNDKNGTKTCKKRHHKILTMPKSLVKAKLCLPVLETEQYCHAQQRSKLQVIQPIIFWQTTS
jgi:hypothetical protein